MRQHYQYLDRSYRTAVYHGRTPSKVARGWTGGDPWAVDPDNPRDAHAADIRCDLGTFAAEYHTAYIENADRALTPIGDETQ